MRRRCPKDERHPLGSFHGKPKALTRYTPEKRHSVSPEAILGVFY